MSRVRLSARQLAAEYDARYAAGRARVGRPSAIARALAAHLDGGQVIEFGAGLGRDSLFLARRGFAVTAVELSEVAVAALAARARRLPAGRLVARRGDARTPLRGRVDGVLTVFLLHHLSEPEARGFLRSTQRHTRPGGVHAHGLLAHGSGPLRAAAPFLPTRAQLIDLYAGWDILHLAEWPVVPLAGDRGAVRRGLSIVARKPHGRTR